MMKVLLIGGNGFIGSHVVDKLLACGARVCVFDRRPEQFRPPLQEVEYVVGDLDDLPLLYETASGADAIIHLASATVPATADLDPVADISGNLIALVRLLEMLRALTIKKFVYLSSGGTVYGPTDVVPISESHPLRPINSYGIVKVAIENYLRMENYLRGMPYVVLRASNPYGPRQGHSGVQGIIGTHLWRIARGQPVEVWGDGSVVRDFIQVEDLADLCVRAVSSDVTGCFNAGSGEGASINDIVSEIDRVVRATGGRPVQPIYKPGRSYDVSRVILDITSARDAWGWTPAISLPEGIGSTWEWVRSQVSSNGI